FLFVIQRAPSSSLFPYTTLFRSHIRDRAMVMKRYPHGAAGEFFFMKRAPSPRPAWVEICAIDHGSKGVIDFPMIQDRAALMWVRSEEHTSELQSRENLVCRLLLE